MGAGDHLGFDGDVRTAAGTAPTTGRDAVRVVDDLFERLLAQDDVTAQDVKLAADFLEPGDLSTDQFELVAEKWIGRGGADHAAADD